MNDRIMQFVAWKYSVFVFCTVLAAVETIFGLSVTSWAVSMELLITAIGLLLIGVASVIEENNKVVLKEHDHGIAAYTEWYNNRYNKNTA